MSPPSRDERKKCWEARDMYFACLDSAGVVAPGEEGKACGSEKKLYTKNCAKSWVEYFNKRRVIADQQKDMLAVAEAQRLEAEAKGYPKR